MGTSTAPSASVSASIDLRARHLPAGTGTEEVTLTPKERRRAEKLLNQQFWLWGHDIRRPDGNALLRHGFSCMRRPAGNQGSNRYTLALGDDRVVALWGFGLFFGDRRLGGMVLSRFRLTPLLSDPWLPPEDVWSLADLPPMRSPRDADSAERGTTLLADALAWVSHYETWVTAALGVSARQEALAAWGKVACAAEEIPGRWHDLACACSACRVVATPPHTHFG